MKTILTIILINLSLFAFAQESEDNSNVVIDSISYKSTQDINYCSHFSNGTEYKKYFSKDGISIKLGDTLIIGKPSTNSNEYTYLWRGKINLAKALFSRLEKITSVSQAQHVIITRIYVSHTKMSDESPFVINLYVKNPSAPAMASNSTFGNYEMAMQLGEIINPKKPLTSDEALAQLKKEKDKLDLGLISQEEYNKRKAELSKLIK